MQFPSFLINYMMILNSLILSFVTTRMIIIKKSEIKVPKFYFHFRALALKGTKKNRTVIKLDTITDSKYYYVYLIRPELKKSWI